MCKERSKISVLRQERLMQMYRDIQSKTGLSQAKFADKVDNLAASDFSKFMTGKKDLSDKMCRRLVEAFPEYGYRVAWLMGDDDIPTIYDLQLIQQHHNIFNKKNKESRTSFIQKLLVKIIVSEQFDSGIILVDEPKDMEQLFKEKYITEKEYTDYCSCGVISKNAQTWLDVHNDYVISIDGKHYHISPQKFFSMAEDGVYYMIFRTKEECKKMDRGCI